ncbi:MAG: hypothetical protein ACHQAV_03635 [Solirubrobacterales bacterium]
MAASHTARRLTAILALAPLVAIAMLLLTRPAPTLAHGSRTACSTSLTRQARPGVPACARSARGKKIHARLRTKARHAKHAVARRRAHGKARVPAGTTTAAVPAPTVPRCEDGTDPVPVGAGSYSCDDGSAPTCPGSNPTFSSDGSGFICGAPATTEMAAPGEPACEDGSAPVQAADGSFACGDGSNATCADGTPASLSEDGSTILCTVSSNGPTGAGEPSCEDGSAPMVEADGSPSCADGSQPTCPNGSSLATSSDGGELACEPS